MEPTNDSFAALIFSLSTLVVVVGAIIQGARTGKSLATVLGTGYRNIQKLTEQQAADARAQGGQVAEGDTLSQKREDALAAMLTITDVLKETRAELTATRLDRTKLRAELAESVATRDLQSGQIASLRVDVDNLKTEAQEREKAHAVALAASQEKIAEQTQTIEAQSKTIARQDATIQALREYVGQLGPLLRKAGIKTDELPQLPPIAANGDSQASGEHKKVGE